MEVAEEENPRALSTQRISEPPLKKLRGNTKEWEKPSEPPGRKQATTRAASEGGSSSELSGNEPRVSSKHKCRRSRELDPSKADWSDLPLEVLLKIFSYLDQRCLSRCAMVNTTFNNITKNGMLYRNVTLTSTMEADFLEALVAKVCSPKTVTIKYIPATNAEHPNPNILNFYRCCRILAQKAGSSITRLTLTNTNDYDALRILYELPELRELQMLNCKLIADHFTSQTNLTSIELRNCHFHSPKDLAEIAKNNPRLTRLHLSNNVNANLADVCESLSMYNDFIEEIYYRESKKLRARSLRLLGRLTMLRKLALISDTNFDCSPGDMLEQIGAGCTNLESLIIIGWKEVTDDLLMPLIHMCTKLKHLHFKNLDITFEAVKEAALLLPNLKTLNASACKKVNKKQLAKLQRDFLEIQIPIK